MARKLSGRSLATVSVMNTEKILIDENTFINHLKLYSLIFHSSNILSVYLVLIGSGVIFSLFTMNMGGTNCHHKLTLL